MAIISTGDKKKKKSSAASPGNNAGARFNSSNQRETCQGLAEDGDAFAH